MYRILKQDGVGFVDGDYGKNTSHAPNQEIADRSRGLNDTLARRRVTADEAKGTVKQAGLSDHAIRERRRLVAGHR